MIWTKSKINHAFVFEYDTRHTLEWRQLLEVRTLLIQLTWDIHAHADVDSLFFLLPNGSFHVAQLLLD